MENVMKIISYKETFMISKTMSVPCKLYQYDTIRLQDVVIEPVNIDVLGS